MPTTPAYSFTALFFKRNLLPPRDQSSIQEDAITSPVSFPCEYLEFISLSDQASSNTSITDTPGYSGLGAMNPRTVPLHRQPPRSVFTNSPRLPSPAPSIDRTYSKTPLNVQDQDMEMASDCIDIRHNPYRRPTARSQPLPRSVTRHPTNKKTSTRKSNPNRLQGTRPKTFHEIVFEIKMKIAEARHHENLQAKKAELLAAARTYVIRGGGRWVEEEFMLLYGDDIIELAEDLVRRDRIDILAGTTEDHYVQVFQLLDKAGQQHEMELERCDKAALAEIEDMDEEITRTKEENDAYIQETRRTAAMDGANYRRLFGC